MFEAAQKPQSYKSEDKQQLLLDVVKANNPKLVRFLIDPKPEEAYPTHSQEERGFLTLSNFGKVKMAALEQNLVEEVEQFLGTLKEKASADTYDQAQLNQEKAEFLATVGQEAKAGILALYATGVEAELPTIKTGEFGADGKAIEVPNFEALIPHIEGSQVRMAKHGDIIANYDAQLSAVIAAHQSIFTTLLESLQLPLAESLITVEAVAALKEEKDAQYLKCDEEFAPIKAEETAVQSRQAQITLCLDANYHFKIIMLQKAANKPEAIAKGTLLLQKKQNSANVEDGLVDSWRDAEGRVSANAEGELVGYWTDAEGQVREQSVKLSVFAGILLPKPGKELESPWVFRSVTAIFGCADLFDTFGAFGANVPERLRATPYEVRVKLTSTSFAAVVMPETGDNLAHIAAMAGSFATFQFLMAYKNGALNTENTAGDLPINAKDEEGKTLLHKAIQKGSVAELEWLIDHGADTSLRDHEGKTVLELALSANELDVFKRLLEKGIDPMLENTEGKTILDNLFALGKQRASTTIILPFLEAFVQHLKKRTTALWPSKIPAIQDYIRKETEASLAKMSKLFEVYLEKIKIFVVDYLAGSIIPRVSDHWLCDVPLLKTQEGYHRFGHRWKACIEVLKAIRNAIKESSPRILQQALEEIKQTFESKRGPFGGSHFLEFLVEINAVHRESIEKLGFEQKRDLYNALEGEKQARARELKELEQRVQTLEAGHAELQKQLQQAHEEIRVLKAEHGSVIMAVPSTALSFANASSSTESNTALRSSEMLCNTA